MNCLRTATRRSVLLQGVERICLVGLLIQRVEQVCISALLSRGGAFLLLLLRLHQLLLVQELLPLLEGNLAILVQIKLLKLGEIFLG